MSWNLATSSNSGVRDLFSLPLFVGSLILRPHQALVLAISTGLWAIAIGLHAVGIVLSESLALIAARLVAITLLLWFSLQHEDLIQSRELLTAVFDSSQLGRALINADDGRVTRHNSTLAQLLGRQDQSLVGEHWPAIAGVAAGTSSSIQTLETCQGQRQLELITAPLPTDSASESQHLIHVIDRTEQIRDQKKLEQQSAELQRALRASLRSAALVHELRQPLALLLLQARQLQRQQQAGAKALDLQLEELQGTAQQINTVMHGIEALLSSANRRKPQPVDLGSLVTAALEGLEDNLNVHAIALERGPFESSLLLEGDRRQLLLAIDNLLRNAIDVLLERSNGQRQLHVSLRQVGGYAEFQVADSGPGLVSMDLNELQLRSSKTGGLGVGLAIVELVAANHGGSLQLGRSKRYGGAELTLNLALAEQGSAMAANG